MIFCLSDVGLILILAGTFFYIITRYHIANFLFNHRPNFIFPKIKIGRTIRKIPRFNDNLKKLAMFFFVIGTILQFTIIHELNFCLI